MSKASMLFLLWPAKVLNFLKKRRQWAEGSLTSDEAAVNPLNSYFSCLNPTWHHIFQRSRFSNQCDAPPYNL